MKNLAAFLIALALCGPPAAAQVNGAQARGDGFARKPVPSLRLS